jgi:hypothetical protein
MTPAVQIIHRNFLPLNTAQVSAQTNSVVAQDTQRTFLNTPQTHPFAPATRQFFERPESLDEEEERIMNALRRRNTGGKTIIREKIAM